MFLSCQWRRLWVFFMGCFVLLVYNEFIVYYLVLIQCQWPTLDSELTDSRIASHPVYKEPLKAMLLADTHLIGMREGHWFDKLRREWQMERVFRTTMLLHSPQLVFFLGDLFDEGKWSNDMEFHDYVTRFHSMFYTSDDTKVKVVVGNHDIGFHYMIDDAKRRRFASAFESPSVELLEEKGNVFVMLNSMAMEGDNCNMCNQAEQMVLDVSLTLNCTKDVFYSDDCTDVERLSHYTKPILLMHFPLYRQSDINCTGKDSASTTEKQYHFIEKKDCLSKLATNKLLNLLDPRLVISGHTHNYCLHTHNTGHSWVPEWTIPSFSWRNKNNPSFLLLVASNNNYAITKCMMPQESTVIMTYIVGVILLSIWLVFPRRLAYRQRTIMPYKTH